MYCVSLAGCAVLCAFAVVLLSVWSWLIFSWLCHLGYVVLCCCVLLLSVCAVLFMLCCVCLLCCAAICLCFAVYAMLSCVVLLCTAAVPCPMLSDWAFIQVELGSAAHTVTISSSTAPPRIFHNSQFCLQVRAAGAG